MDSQSKNGQSWRMRLLFTLCALLLAVPAFSQAKDLPRVMSLNLCADPYLMAFADKAQIVGLTFLSRDKSMSPHAEAAQNFPVSDGQIESIIALRPDIIIVSNWSDPMRNALIERLGIKLVSLDAAQNYAAARQEIRRLGKAIGREKQAAAYLAELDTALAALTPVAHAPRILALQRRNLTVGKGHILDEIIALAGAENSGAALARNMGHISLETALATKADFLLLSEATNYAANGPDSRGMEFITHPALSKAYPAARQLFLPHNLLVCSGASTPRAVAALIEQLNQGQKPAASAR